jgi:hypothetical protein
MGIALKLQDSARPGPKHCLSHNPAFILTRMRGASPPWLGGLQLVLLTAALACGGGSEQSAGDSSGSAAEGSEPRYVPEVDEGIGASVAILLDNSGSMEDEAEGDDRPKYVVAREALAAVLAATDSFIAREPDFPVKIGLYRFANDVERLIPIAPYNGEALRAALEHMENPDGGTAIGDAMDMARADLYRAGTYRKYILVVTDGENNRGRSPSTVAREIARRSEGAVRQYFVAFDIDADRFAFLREVQGEVLGASNGAALRASLDTLYRGRILAEALDAGETLPDSVKPATTRGR